MRVIGTFSLPRSSGPRVFSACALRGPEEPGKITRLENKQRMIYRVIAYSRFSFLLLSFYTKYIKQRKVL